MWRGDPDCEQAGYLAIDPAKTLLGAVYADPRAVDSWPEIGIGRAIGPHTGVAFTSISFAEDSYGRFILKLSKFMHETIERFRPLRIFAEQPVHLPAADSFARASVMFGAKGIITLHAELRGILPLRMINPSAAKIALTGEGKASKADMVAAAERRGWRVRNDNEADAFGIMEAGVALERSVVRLGRMQERVDAAVARGAMA